MNDNARFTICALDAALVALDDLCDGQGYSKEDLIAAAYALDFLALQGHMLRRIACDSTFAGSEQGAEIAAQLAHLLREIRERSRARIAHVLH
ncbi:hypothetical protein [Xanthomonas campestris]|uniref:hypothetical protein n=1 Tax=Xanthomonas campestris TaxID=339 RepID=UPI0023785073|nr:hypothetical protein [Xanthomonas campestris]WDK04497.1 hypothetical protein JH273_21490 [Xanthomonas campestris]